MQALEIEGAPVEFAAADAGDIMGQTALTRERTPAVTVAEELLTVVVLTLDTVDELIHSRPRFTAGLSESRELTRTLAGTALNGLAAHTGFRLTPRLDAR